MTTSARADISLASTPTTYSRDIFGHFIEHFHRQVYGGIFEPGSQLTDERGFRLDVIEAMRELRPSVVRWPGGCFVSGYHWVDGVGPDRVPFYDKAWRVTDPNTFGTKEFIAWCEAIGAAPYICTNAGTGTAEQMSDWVEYTNLPAGSGKWSDLRAAHGDQRPFDVRYWSIGNENYGDWEIGAKDAHEWSRLVAESAKMMRHVDEDLILLTAARADLDWMLPLLNEAGQFLDTLSIHGYWDKLSQVDEPSDYLTSIAQSVAPQDDIQRTREIIGAAGLTGKISIAFDEWNLRGWHHPNGNSPEKLAARDRNDLNSTYTVADALFSASFFNTCLRNADIVSMANIAPSVNTRGPLYVHADGVVRRTTFHVMSMYATLLGDRALTSSAQSRELPGTDIPVFDHLATIDEATGQLSIVLINREPVEDLQVTLSIGGVPVDGTFPSTVLSGPNVDAFNDVDRPDAVVPIERQLGFHHGVVNLEPHSVTICQIALPLAHGAGAVETPAPGLAWELDGRLWHRNATA
ncbi:alpha-N-arabinofuranosidase [Plantibacter sp. MCCC 1A11337]|uniref:alpha-L-arabinofuranosidase C-terminal domain-containing protein n=1 Tax=Plantibacter sp. MCCC 1A11337 TaxID=2736644 RepID=UPI00158422C4|nr:alpha-L-arabinofuranosidase C-terminal domain-containing protein [Plantibacter sp. MCCC 1A11337]NUJ89091.1 alpha-N-arabinofuranosidase [Plantibacter sp. MCCC 1A11337]